jgi:hypothetical protein
MGDLYSAAKVVVIWLGPLQPRFKDFIWGVEEFLPRLSTHMASNKLGLRPGSLLNAKNIQEIGFEHLNIVTKLLRMSLYYLSCRWFTRSWVVQEFYLA